MDTGAMKQIRLVESEVRQLSNQNLITLLTDFGFFIVESDDRKEEIVLNREAMIQKAVRTSMDLYTIARTNCDPDEEAYGRCILDRWSYCWEYC
jgi:hypothetical protein